MDVRSDLALSGGAKITGLPAGSASGHAVEYAQWQAALQGLAWKENCRVATTANINISSAPAAVDGVTLSNGDRVLVKNQTTASENGIYIFNGAAAAMTRSADADLGSELLSAVAVIDEGTANADTTWRMDTIAITVGSTALSWVAFGSSAPAASETTAGIAEIATQAETDTGTDDARMVTPLKLKTSPWARKQFSATFGDGSATQYDITHNLGTTDVTIAVRNVSTGAEVLCDRKALSTTVVRLNFITAPTTNELRCTVLA